MLHVQGSLFAGGPCSVRDDARFERIDLSDTAWVEVARGWFGGADDLMGRLQEAVEWRRHQRWMYERMVDEPRLSRWYAADDDLPDEGLAAFRNAAGRHYHHRFGALALNFYRDGSDSVAFHTDRELRNVDDTLVVILTLGAARPFQVRPVGGGRSIDLRPGSGDLLVMGGSCQASWEHGVPKVARGAGARISASIRWARQGGFERKWTPAGRIESA
ncbi:MAG TPA: alpha-ketoglutarate-dependent dioxygenase AlkB [Acidimicrobiales bacterium]|nr:alpha-ketoglutarate-dependent dioxygenase AlkB [Acidimicrobiales bacterium]